MSEKSSLPLPNGVEADRVLKKLKSDKTIEALHQEALRRLKDNPEFNEHVQELVAKSEAIKREGARRQTKLREELEDKVVEDAMKKYYEILNSRDQGMALKIESHVQAALVEVLEEHSKQQQQHGGGGGGS